MAKVSCSLSITGGVGWGGGAVRCGVDIGLQLGKACYSCMRVLPKVLSLGSDYFSATFYQTYFYYKPSKYSPCTETHFCNLFTQSSKADK